MRTVYFVGVTTAGSSIDSLFPRWMARLGVEARIEGVDLPLGAPEGRYRDLLRRIADDPRVAGAVITAHKLGMYAAAHHLFDAMDRFVPLCREVSAIAKRDGQVVALARDAVAAGATLRTILGAGYWSHHRADVLCFGAGGAATAIALCLLSDPATISGDLRPASVLPRRILFVDIDRGRLAALRRMAGAVNPRARVEYLYHPSAADKDALLAGLPPGSLIINATGMGKERPGSPLTDRAAFPASAVVWDLNYRGALPFLRQARAQQERQVLRVNDGWLLFLHGWTQALSPILGVDLTEAVFADRAEAQPPIAPGGA
ncbi:MAG: shikimate dehydrogenase [Chloroflexi bacterium]|nr:shikimate dehydrogenase [Chloroflexota bacterium]